VDAISSSSNQLSTLQLHSYVNHPLVEVLQLYVLLVINFILISYFIRFVDLLNVLNDFILKRTIQILVNQSNQTLSSTSLTIFIDINWFHHDKQLNSL
jgi:hypothetical protein